MSEQSESAMALAILIFVFLIDGLIYGIILSQKRKNIHGNIRKPENNTCIISILCYNSDI